MQPRALFHRLTVAQTVSGVGGALVVAAFLTAFFAGYGDGGVQIALNTAVLAVYLTFGFFAGRAWGRRQFAPVERWLLADRPPTAEEREAVLRGPLDGLRITAGLWGGGVLVFTVINLRVSVGTGLGIGAAVLLGGATTCALAYLSFERVMRPVMARVLSGGPPPRPTGPGVGTRIGMAWLLGSGVPALAIVGLTAIHILGGDVDHDQIVFAATFLAIVMLVAGLAAVRAVARSVAEPIAAMRAALGRVEAGAFATRIDVEDGSEVGLLQAGFNRMAEGLGERERIREAFGTYVDPAVAEHILREGTSLQGEEVEVTVMFVDVRDFTGFAERASAPEVVAALNGLFERIVPIVRGHGGHVDKFVGDGLLAVFGAPRRAERHAANALAAALEIEQAVAGDRLEVGIGLNSGQVVAGNVGGAGRLEFSVIGDAVNVAARVEAATRVTGDRILAAQRTRELAGDGCVFTERPGVQLKGKRDPVALYAVSAAARGRERPGAS
jgi:adenylate cyclase